MHNSEQTRHSVLKAAILINVLARSTDCYNYLVFTNSLYVVGKVACHTFQKANRVRYIIYVLCLIPRDARSPSKPTPSHDGWRSPKHYRTGVNIVKFDLHNLQYATRCYSRGWNSFLISSCFSSEETGHHGSSVYRCKTVVSVCNAVSIIMYW